jgi:hypothetical protein
VLRRGAGEPGHILHAYSSRSGSILPLQWFVHHRTAPLSTGGKQRVEGGNQPIAQITAQVYITSQRQPYEYDCVDRCRSSEETNHSESQSALIHYSLTHSLTYSPRTLRSKQRDGSPDCHLYEKLLASSLHNIRHTVMRRSGVSVGIDILRICEANLRRMGPIITVARTT